MIRALLAAGAAILVSTLAPPPAAAALGQRNSEKIDTETQFDRVMAALSSGKPATVLPELDQTIAVARAAGDRDAEGLVLGLRANVLLAAGRRADALKDYASSEALLKDQGFTNFLRFAVALDAKGWNDAAIALDRLIAGYPDLARDIDPQNIYFYLSTNKTTPSKQIDDQRIALARMGYGGADGVSLTVNAISALLKRGQAGEAAELVPFVDDVRRLQETLVSRRFEPLWPVLEKSAGDRSALAGAERIRRTRIAFADNARDAAALRNLVSALSTAGQNEEALTAGAAVGADPTALAALDEDRAWVVNEHALALHRAGKADEADRRYADLNVANAAKPWVVSMVINRLELLVQDGKSAAADALMAEARTVADKFGSPYAKQLVRRLDLCNAVALRRTAELATRLAEVRAHADDAKHATIEGLLCAGDMAGAERMTLALLADPDDGGEVVALLQKRPLARDDPSLWSRLWSKLRDRPAIEAAFHKAGRDLPARFYTTN